MRRLLFVPVVVSVLTALGGAQATDTLSPTAERARQLHRDRKLVAKFVDGGIYLAGTRTDEAMQRAQCCNGVAEHVAGEIEASIQEGDILRAELLGGHFRKLLVGGVALNLNQARQQFPPGSTDERKVFDLGERNVQLAKKLETKLRLPAGVEQRDVQVVLQAVADGRAEVQKTLPPTPKKK